MEKVLFDTDIGTDIDDAMCLAYLLAKKDCDLVGVTTVNGDTAARAQIVYYLCEASGRTDIPICAGIEKAMILERKLKNVSYLQGVPNPAPKDNFTKQNAIDFMRDIIVNNPHEVTLLATGPFTNVGILLVSHPEVIPLLKGITVMGGNYFNPYNGYGLFSSNAMYDPHATSIMFDARVNSSRALGSDVTNDVTMPVVEKELFADVSIASAVLPLVPYYFGKWDRPILYHDAIAAATIFNDKIAEFVNGKVQVELQGTAMQGATLFKRCGYIDNYNQVARSVNRDEFVREFLSAFGITYDKTATR